MHRAGPPNRGTSRIRKPSRLTDVPDARPSFTSNKIDLKLSPDAPLIQRYIRSLEFLVADIGRKKSGVRTVTVTNGRRITTDTSGYGYQFALTQHGKSAINHSCRVIVQQPGVLCVRSWDKSVIRPNFKLSKEEHLVTHFAMYFQLRHVSAFEQCLVALGILFLTCKASGAATLFTSLLSIETANPGKPLSALDCYIVNVSKTPRNGTISIIGADGSPLSFGSYSNTPPGSFTGIHAGVFSTQNPQTLAYCKITVTNAPASSIRGSFTRTDQNGNTVVSIEAR